MKERYRIEIYDKETRKRDVYFAQEIDYTGIPKNEIPLLGKSLIFLYDARKKKVSKKKIKKT